MATPRPPLLALRTAAVLLGLSVALLGCTRPPADATTVRVGAGSTAEQQLLAALSVDLLRQRGVDAEVVAELGDTGAVREAALAGLVDAMWAYSGATWTLGLGLSAPPADGRESVEAVAAEEAEVGLRWLAPSGANAALALFVTAADAPAPEEATTTWLAGQLGQRQGAVCADAAFLEAPGGWPLLTDTYAIAGDQVTTITADETQAVAAVAAGECLAGLAPATSGAARAADMVPLADDQGVFPALILAPVVAEGGRAATPPVEAALTDLAASLTTADLAALNARVLAGEPIDEVAAAHLEALGLG